MDFYMNKLDYAMQYYHEHNKLPKDCESLLSIIQAKACNEIFDKIEEKNTTDLAQP